MKYDISIIGGGIVGGMICRNLALQYPTKKIALLEKEKDVLQYKFLIYQLGLHTSTRNSAVLHAGLYYSTASIKANICAEGCKLLGQYCLDNKIPMRATGKFLVPRNAQENQRIHEIKKQGDINKVELELMECDQALKIQKHLKIHDKNFQYLYSPTTKVADQFALMKHLKGELAQMNNVTIHSNVKYDQLVSKDQSGGSTHRVINNGSQQMLETGYIINSAGLYADKIAKQYGFAKNYAIWPIKGTYLIAKAEHLPPTSAIIYPVPPLKGNFFLGIHTTLTIAGDLKIGPSIFPAMWREEYTMQENFNMQEFLEIAGLNVYSLFSKDMSMYAQTFVQELKKRSKSYMIKEAKSLTTQLDGIDDSKLLSIFNRGRAGIRAQLFDTSKRQMVQDFIMENDKHSLHLLNVASPGWTCSIPMAGLVINELKQYL